MTPDQRLDRAERMLILFVKAGRPARKASREQDQKINILVQAQMETTEQIKRLAANTDKEIAEVRREQRLTFQALRAFINSQRKGNNGKSSN
jgi:hypothetical protein